MQKRRREGGVRHTCISNVARQRPRVNVIRVGMFARLRMVQGIVNRTFGFTPRPILIFFLLTNHRIFSAFARVFDNVFYPRWRDTPLGSPVFIVGNPRSGTTFLHRFMVDQKIGVGHQLWQLLFPYLTGRTLIRPFIPLLEKVSPARFHASKAHPTSLSSVETDDVLSFFRYVDGLFLYGYFLAWDEHDHLPELERQLGETAGRDFTWLRDCFQKNLIWYGAKPGQPPQDRNIGKLFSMALRPKAALDAFPEGKFLYMVRDPMNVVPSGMSLLTGVIRNALPWDKASPESRARYLERIYLGSLQLFTRFHEAYVAGELPPDRVYIVRYHRLMAEFDVVMREICVFIGQPLTPELEAVIDATAKSQRSRKSEHDYNLAEFGLTKERIHKDFAFVYDTFEIPRS